MPLTLKLNLKTSLPIDLRNLSTATNEGLPSAEVADLEILVGNRATRVDDCFSISGQCKQDRQLRLTGPLDRAHGIGQNLKRGTIVVDSNAGRHVGTSMSGGQITINGNASDYVGAAMTGGQIRILGNAGDFVGGALAGAAYGMNRGEIIITGDAGRGLGRRMRRGLIVVCGSTRQLVAWEMLAGTIVVFGAVGQQVATEMSRGTLVLTDPKADLGSDFYAGAKCQPPILNFIGNWLKRTCPELLPDVVEQKLLNQPFIQYNGGRQPQHRAEVFVTQ